MTDKTPNAKKQKKSWREILIDLAGIPVVITATYLGYKYFYDLDSIGTQGLLKLLLNNAKQIGLMVLAAAFVIMLVGFIILLQAVLGKWRRVNVFLSYQHQHAALATKLEGVLKTKWIKPDFIHFAPADHDVIIEKVQRSIKKSDLLIILPGLEKSFVDAEIMLASSLKKPIIFLKITEDQRIPDTSYRGYPVFDLQKLEAYQFKPLNRFILYVTKSSKDVLLNFLRTLIAFYNKSENLSLALGAVFLLYIISGFITTFFGSLALMFKIGRIFFWVAIIVVIGYFIFRYVKVIIERLRAISVTRQTIRTGNMSYALLVNCFTELEADKEILHCINVEPLNTTY
jgi:hypothetical protein